MNAPSPPSPRGPLGSLASRALAVACFGLGLVLLSVRARFRFDADDDGSRRFELGWPPWLSGSVDQAELIGATESLGWPRILCAVAAAALGAAVARALRRRGSSRPLVLGLGCAAALFFALDPGLLAFVARRGSSGAPHYLEVEDSLRGVGVALLGCSLWCALPRRAPCAPRAPRAVRRPALALTAACLVAGGLPLVWSAVFLGFEPLTNDECSYRFQAELFAAGHAAVKLGPFAELFPARQVHALQGTLFSKYPPGQALCLVPGMWLGFPLLLPRLLGALVPLLVHAMARRLGCARPLLAAWLFALSPTPLVLGGLWLAHGTSLPFGAAFLWLALRALDKCDGRGQERRVRAGWLDALAAGACLSLCGLARPGTAVALGLPFLAAVCARPSRALALIPAALIGALPAGLVFLGYNLRTTGEALVPAYVLYAREVSPDDTWGWVNASSAWPGFALNAARGDLWLHGIAASAGLAAVGFAVFGGRRRWVLWSVPASLFGFYALLTFHGVPWAGPLYWVEAFPVLAVASAEGLDWLARRVDARALPVGLATAGLGAVTLLAVRGTLARAELAERRAPARAAAASGFERGVVLVPIESELHRKRWFLAPPVALATGGPLPPLVLVAAVAGPTTPLPPALAGLPRGWFDARSGRVLPLD